MRKRSEYTYSLPVTSTTKEVGVIQRMHVPVVENKAIVPVAKAKARHDGAGWYTLPDGSKMRGRAAVVAAGFDIEESAL